MQNQLNQALKILDQEGLSVNRCIEGDEYLIEGVMTEKQIIATAEVMSPKEMDDCEIEYKAIYEVNTPKIKGTIECDVNGRSFESFKCVPVTVKDPDWFDSCKAGE